MKKQAKEQHINTYIIDAMMEKKANGIVLMDFTKMSNLLYSYFIVCDGTSTTQVQAITEHISKHTRKEARIHPVHIEGTSNLQWVLIDYGETVVHVFLDEIRQYYKLEEVWADTTITRLN